MNELIENVRAWGLSKGITAAVAEATGLEAAGILSPCRDAEHSRARFLLAVLLREWRPAMSQATIARHLKLADHTSGRHAIRRGLDLLETDLDFAALYRKCRAILDQPETFSPTAARDCGES